MAEGADLGLSVEFDTTAVQRFLSAMDGALKKSVMRRLRAFGADLRARMRATVPVKSGRARAAVSSSVRTFPDGNFQVKLSGNPSKAPHWPQMEHGALIRPRNAQKLAIPIPGSSIEGLIESGLRPRDILEDVGGRVFTRNDVVYIERAGQVEPVFVLKREVLRKRGNYFKNFGTSGVREAFVTDVMGAVDEAVKEAANQS